MTTMSAFISSATFPAAQKGEGGAKGVFGSETAVKKRRSTGWRRVMEEHRLGAAA